MITHKKSNHFNRFFTASKLTVLLACWAPFSFAAGSNTNPTGDTNSLLLVCDSEYSCNFGVSGLTATDSNTVATNQPPLAVVASCPSGYAPGSLAISCSGDAANQMTLSAGTTSGTYESCTKNSLGGYSYSGVVGNTNQDDNGTVNFQMQCERISGAGAMTSNTFTPNVSPSCGDISLTSLTCDWTPPPPPPSASAST